MIPKYDNIDDMWWEALADISLSGRDQESRAGQTTEVIGWSGRLMDIDSNFLACARRKLSPTYAMAELLWYLSRANDVKALLPYAPQYERFTEADGTAYGAYGHRIAKNVAPGFQQTWDQLDLAERVLQKPDSRQCIITFWRADDLLEASATPVGKKDLPCTVCWQFFIRDKQLHMTAYMRSNDVWLGMPYDIFVNTTIQKLFANTLGLGGGTYTHSVGSLHLYEKNLRAARECLHDVTTYNSWGRGDKFKHVEKAVEAEQRIREGTLIHRKDVIRFCNTHSLRDVLRDAVMCIALHYGLTVPDDISSPQLRESAYAHYRGLGPSRQDDTVQIVGKHPESSF